MSIPQADGARRGRVAARICRIRAQTNGEGCSSVTGSQGIDIRGALSSVVWAGSDRPGAGHPREAVAPDGREIAKTTLPWEIGPRTWCSCSAGPVTRWPRLITRRSSRTTRTISGAEHAAWHERPAPRARQGSRLVPHGPGGAEGRRTCAGGTVRRRPYRRPTRSPRRGAASQGGGRAARAGPPRSQPSGADGNLTSNRTSTTRWLT